MLEEIRAGGFLEHAQVHGNLYGTSLNSIREVEKEGKICVFDIDVDGLKQVIARTPEGSLNRVGIIPLSMEDLEYRLRGRATDSENSIRRRIQAATQEIKAIEEGNKMVDAIIKNEDSWKVGFPALLEILYKWYPEIRSNSETSR